MGMRVGYARVSSKGQKLDVPMDRLADCERVFSEKASGTTAKDRPELQRAPKEKCGSGCFGQGIDTTTLYGRLQFNILAAIGEFERRLVKVRSTEGRARAVARGVKYGAKPKLTKKEIEEMVSDCEAPGCSKKEIAEHYGISRSSVYRLYTENRQQCVCSIRKAPDPATGGAFGV